MELLRCGSAPERPARPAWRSLENFLACQLRGVDILGIKQQLSLENVVGAVLTFWGAFLLQVCQIFVKAKLRSNSGFSLEHEISCFAANGSRSAMDLPALSFEAEALYDEISETLFTYYKAPL